MNKIQERYLQTDFDNRSVILKARQEGFSSLITAIFTCDFILQEHSYSVIVADIEDNATGLLNRVKSYLESYKLKTGIKIQLKYDSKFELYNSFMDSRFVIGTAKNIQFGRSRTISNLHLSEVAFYPNIQDILAGCVQAVTETGKIIMETTANGFNEFKGFWDKSKLGETGYKPLFYGASEFYTQDFLRKKKAELGDKYPQEYPETDFEAFVTSGDCYFDKETLRVYYDNATKPIQGGLVYV